MPNPLSLAQSSSNIFNYSLISLVCGILLTLQIQLSKLNSLYALQTRFLLLNVLLILIKSITKQDTWTGKQTHLETCLSRSTFIWSPSPVNHTSMTFLKSCLSFGPNQSLLIFYLESDDGLLFGFTTTSNVSLWNQFYFSNFYHATHFLKNICWLPPHFQPFPV